MTSDCASKAPIEPLRVRILRALVRVAPDIDPVTIDFARPIREQYDFDSVDLMNFAISLKQDLGLEIPDEDLAHLASVAGCESYLSSRSVGHDATHS